MDDEQPIIDMLYFNLKKERANASNNEQSELKKEENENKNELEQ